MDDFDLKQIHARLLCQELLLNRLWVNVIAHRPDWRAGFEGNRDTVFRLLNNGEAKVIGTDAAYAADTAQFALSYAEKFWDQVGQTLDLIFEEPPEGDRDFGSE